MADALLSLVTLVPIDLFGVGVAFCLLTVGLVYSLKREKETKRRLEALKRQNEKLIVQSEALLASGKIDRERAVTMWAKLDEISRAPKPKVGVSGAWKYLSDALSQDRQFSIETMALLVGFLGLFGLAFLLNSRGQPHAAKFISECLVGLSWTPRILVARHTARTSLVVADRPSPLGSR